MEQDPIQDSGGDFVLGTTGLNLSNKDNNLGTILATRSQQFNLSDILGPFTSTTGPTEEGKETHSYFFFKVIAAWGFVECNDKLHKYKF